MSIGGPIQVLLAAQSNGEGANNGSYPAPYARGINRSDIKAQKYTKIGATGLDQPWGNLQTNQPAGDNWTGPDLPICVDLVDDFGRTGTHLIMRALGSTGLAVEWLPTDTVGATGQDWRDFRDRVLAERAANPSVCAGARPWLVWIQGEEDASVQAEADAYEANLRTLMQQCTRYFGAGLRVVLVYLHDDCTRTYRSTVRAAQEAIAAEWEGRVFPLDPTGICTVSGDGIHYDDQGLAVGKAIAAIIAAAAP